MKLKKQSQFIRIEKGLFYFNPGLTPINGNPQRPEPRKQIPPHGDTKHGYAVICCVFFNLVRRGKFALCLEITRYDIRLFLPQLLENPHWFCHAHHVGNILAVRQITFGHVLVVFSCTPYPAGKSGIRIFRQSHLAADQDANVSGNSLVPHWLGKGMHPGVGRFVRDKLNHSVLLLGEIAPPCRQPNARTGGEPAATGIVDALDMCIIVDNWGTDEPLCDIGPTPGGAILIRLTSKRSRGIVSSFCIGSGRGGRGREGCAGA